MNFATARMFRRVALVLLLGLALLFFFACAPGRHALRARAHRAGVQLVGGSGVAPAPARRCSSRDGTRTAAPSSGGRCAIATRREAGRRDPPATATGAVAPGPTAENERPGAGEAPDLGEEKTRPPLRFGGRV